MPPRRRSSNAGAAAPPAPVARTSSRTSMTKFGSSKNVTRPGMGGKQQSMGRNSKDAIASKYGRAARKKADKKPTATVPPPPPPIGAAVSVPPPPKPVDARARTRVAKVRRFKENDKVQARLEDSSILVGKVRRVYEARDETGAFVGRYKIDWEGTVEDMEFSDAESDQLEEYEDVIEHSPFFDLFRCIF